MTDDKDVIDEIVKQLRPINALGLLLGTIHNAQMILLIRQQRGATALEMAGAAASLMADIFKAADAYHEANKSPF